MALKTAVKSKSSSDTYLLLIQTYFYCATEQGSQRAKESQGKVFLTILENAGGNTKTI